MDPIQTDTDKSESNLAPRQEVKRHLWRQHIGAIFGAALWLVTLSGAALWQTMPVQADFVPAGNLKLHYAFDENSASTRPVDSSGNNHTGTLGGSSNPTPSTDVPTTDFANSHSRYFNGTNYVKGPGYKTLDANGDLTLSAWIKTSDFANRQTIFSTTQNGGYNLEINGTSGGMDGDCNPNTLCGHIWTNGSGDDYGTIQYSLNNLSENTWTHVSMTYLVSQGTQNLILYVDGQKVQTSNVTGSLTPPADNVPLCVGAEATATSCSGNYYTGRIDDARVYSRVLSAGEIADVADGKNATATWNGSSSSIFNNSTNWTPMGVPDASSKIIIPSSTSTPNSPKLARDTGIASLTLATNAKFYTNGYNLTFDAAGGETFSNDGTLYLNGGETLHNFTNDTDSGTVVYDGSGHYTNLIAGNNYYNLEFNGTGDTALSAALTVNNNLTIHNVGDLDAGSATIKVGGNWMNAGTFNSGTSTVILNGSNQSISDDTTFYNLTKSNSSTSTLTFEAGKTQTVTNNLILNGASDNLLSLVSSTPGTQWKIDPQNTTSLSHLSVSDSNNISTELLKPSNSTLGDDPDTNTNWDVITPALSNVGGTDYVNGVWSTDTAPTIPFTITDTDDDAKITYQVQIDDSEDFTSPLIDYTSSLNIPGDFSFTVGQDAGTGSYTTGSSGQTLSDGMHYWRIKATDNGQLTSGWSTASNGDTISGGIDTVTPNTPTAGPKGGTYTSNQTVALSATDNSGGSGIDHIYYTLDGSTPDSSSTKYTGTISVSANKTIKFIAYDLAGNSSSVASENYIIDTVAPNTPTASPGGGTYNSVKTVTLSATDSSGGTGIDEIYYTTDGTTPTRSSTKYTSAISISSNETLKAIAYDNAGNASEILSEEYIVDVAKPNTPTASSKGGSYKNTQTITLTASDNSGGTGIDAIYYTTNGTTPTSSSTKYTSAITVSANETIKFIAYDLAGNSSSVASERYIIDATNPGTPTASPGGGKYTETQQISLSATDDNSGIDHIYYTTDGSTPDSSSTKYTGPISVSANTTIKAIAYDNAGNVSGIMSQEYTIDTDAPSTPDASTKGGIFNGVQIITLTASDKPGGTGMAGIYYTLDGSTPDSSSTKYTGPIGISANTTIKAIAYDNAGNVSGIMSQKYIIDTIAPIVISLTPADNSTGARTNSNLIITFSEPIFVKNGTITIYRASDNSVVATIPVTGNQVSGNGSTTITINPLLDLENDTTYYVMVSNTAFQDVVDNAFSGISNKTSWNFTTIKAPPEKPAKKPEDEGGINGGNGSGDGGGTTKDFHKNTNDTGGNGGDGSDENGDESKDTKDNPENSARKDQAKTKIQEYAKSHGKGTPPTLQDYQAAGITGVNANNIDAINRALTEGNYSDIDSLAGVQSLVNDTTNAPTVHFENTGQEDDQQNSATKNVGVVLALAVLAILSRLIFIRRKS